MKRDPRLQQLSREHHHALVLARALTAGDDPFSRVDAAALGERFDRELAPHFDREETVLLPALRQAGATTLAERTADDHACLRRHIAAARAGDPEAARAFGHRLHEHVRFEERELFAACEALLPGDVLARLTTDGTER